MPAIVEKFPMVEVIFRAGDTRPVVLQLYATNDSAYEVQLSPGNYEDLDQLQAALAAVDPIVQSAKQVRYMYEMLDKEGKFESTSTDDPPF